MPSSARAAEAMTTTTAAVESSPSTLLASPSSGQVASTALRAGRLASGTTYSPSSVDSADPISTALKPPGGDESVAVALEKVGVGN